MPRSSENSSNWCCSRCSVWATAYGATIRREIQDRTHREVPIGSVYVTLARLERKKMVVSYVGALERTRRPRRKHYLMHDAGQHALGRACRALKAMSQGIGSSWKKLWLPERPRPE